MFNLTINTNHSIINILKILSIIGPIAKCDVIVYIIIMLRRISKNLEDIKNHTL